jgi:hypothetical protein
MKLYTLLAFGLFWYNQQANAQALSYEQQIQPQHKIDLDKQRAAEQAAEKKQSLPHVAICNQNANLISKEEQLQKEIVWCEQRISHIQTTYQNQISNQQTDRAQLDKTQKALVQMQAQKAEKEAALAKLKSNPNK